MSDTQARVASFVFESFQRLIDACVTGDASLMDRAWWEVGVMVFPAVVQLTCHDGRQAFEPRSDVAIAPGAEHVIGHLLGVPVYLVPGDRIALKVPHGSLDDPFEDVPVFIAWHEPRRGMMCATSIPDQPPMPLREVMDRLPHPRIGEARRVFCEAFRQGLVEAYRGVS